MENNSIDLFAPLASLQWVDRDKLHANDYNPNKVSEENLKLLVQSILTNGWTLPIVVRPDYTIIDGFHRWTVSGREPLRTKLGGKVPCVIVDHHVTRARTCTAPSPTTVPVVRTCWSP